MQPEILDLSNLPDGKRKVFETFNKPAMIALQMVVCVVALNVFAIIGYWRAEDELPGNIAVTIVKVLGLLCLGWWTRSWSRLAVIILIVWYAGFTYHLIFAEKFLHQLIFWVPTVVFLFALHGANVRAGLVRKALETQRTEQDAGDQAPAAVE